ncbi:hypothetical protein TNCV_1396371 [Trichonephila clavipes]|nr:hypothetical protein TNCV_1396371 [Trichonephila clavipes]
MIPTNNRRSSLLSIRDGNPLQAKMSDFFSRRKYSHVPYSGFEPEPTRLHDIGNSAFLLAAAFAYLFARILAPDSVENRR